MTRTTTPARPRRTTRRSPGTTRPTGALALSPAAPQHDQFRLRPAVRPGEALAVEGGLDDLGNWQLSGVPRSQRRAIHGVGHRAAESRQLRAEPRQFRGGPRGGQGRGREPDTARWFDPTAYALPPAGFQGTAGRNTLIGPPSGEPTFRWRNASRLAGRRASSSASTSTTCSTT